MGLRVVWLGLWFVSIIGGGDEVDGRWVGRVVSRGD